MKNLTLIRHAEAQPQQFFESDKDRKLTEKGLYQIEIVANQLKEKKCLPDYLLCSPAKRTLQTAQLICNRLKINPKLINLNSILYTGNAEDITKLISSLNLTKQAFIIGHNPTLSCLAQKLCPATQSIILPTAGIVSLQFDIENWDDLLTKQGRLLFFIEP
ncbi:MAG: putative phosphohistidine phosphatase SixA [Pseudomonadota bacterium]|jgi:phosphohistidine phosphatase